MKTGGTIDGVLAGLNKILDICIPKEKQEGGTMVIPGHGRISDEADVLEYRDMLKIIRDRILDAVKKGRTLQQVQAAGLTKDYDGRYGATTGPGRRQCLSRLPTKPQRNRNSSERRSLEKS